MQGEPGHPQPLPDKGWPGGNHFPELMVSVHADAWSDLPGVMLSTDIGPSGSDWSGDDGRWLVVADVDGAHPDLHEWRPGVNYVPGLLAAESALSALREALHALGLTDVRGIPTALGDGSGIVRLELDVTTATAVAERLRDRATGSASDAP